MILQWLREDFEALFQRDPRARVGLWYDGKREFGDLLGDLAVELTQAGIFLVALDPAKGNGPLWVKWAVEAGPAANGKAMVWLPCSREEFGIPSAGGLRLDCLLEYRYAGIEWLIEGKPPTLFGFLRSHGVPLPSKRSEQMDLWRGDAGSLLVQYVRANKNRDEVFWTSRSLTASGIRDSIVGDLDKRMLSLLSDPAREARHLREKGVEAAFLAQVEEEYGLRLETDGDLEGWAQDMAERLVLLEVYTALGEPDGFPYLARLPEAGRRERWLALLSRWMRDLDHVEAFTRYSRQMDDKLGLEAWAEGRPGKPQSLLSLSRARWKGFLMEIQNISSSEGLRNALRNSLSLFEQEAGGFWADVGEQIPGWRLALDLLAQIEAIAAADQECQTLKEASAFVAAYAERWHAIDLHHWRILVGAWKHEDLEVLADIADRFYRTFLDQISQRFYESFAEGGVWPPEGCRGVVSVAETLYAVPHSGRRAILVADALRFDLAVELAARFADAKAEAVVANVPTETSVGMTSLIPHADVQVEVSKSAMVLQSASAGGDLAYRAYRWKLLRSLGAQPLGTAEGEEADDLSALRDMARPPKELPQLLVLFDRGVDALGHPGGADVCDHFETVLGRLERAVQKLRCWGYADIHVVTDHGFVLLRDAASLLAMQAPDAVRVAPRYAILPQGTECRTGAVPMSLDPRWLVQLPPGLRSYAKPGSFFHGGATLQEAVIPHLTFSFKRRLQKLRVEVSLAENVIYGQTVVVSLALPLLEGLDLFSGDAVSVRVFLGTPEAPRSKERAARLTAPDDVRQQVTLFLNREPRVRQGERIPIQVLDAATGESYAPKLYVEAGKDLE